MFHKYEKCVFYPPCNVSPIHFVTQRTLKLSILKILGAHKFTWFKNKTCIDRVENRIENRIENKTENIIENRVENRVKEQSHDVEWSGDK